MGAGAHSSENHPIPNDSRIRDGETLRVDFGGLFQGYMSDVARMASVGPPTDADRAYYGKLAVVQEETIDMLRPGIAACEIFERVQQRMSALGIPIDKDFVGHSIGTAAHERPFLTGNDRTLLEPNMVFAIEPSHTKPGAVRYHVEDLVIVTDRAPKRITDHINTHSLFQIG